MQADTLHRFGSERESDLLEHIQCIIFDVAGIDHTVLRFYSTKVVSYQLLLNDSIRGCVDWEISSGDQPWGFIMGESFQCLAAVAAQMVDDTVENSLFTCRKDTRVKRRCLLDGIIAIVPIAEIDIAIPALPQASRCFAPGWPCSREKRSVEEPGGFLLQAGT